MIDDHRWTGPDIPVANGSARPPAVGAGPIERSAMVNAELPCPSCVHRTVCGIRPLIDASELSFRTPPSPHEAIRVVLTAVITCAHYLEDPIPEETPKVPFTPTFAATDAERRAASRRGAAANRERIRAELAGRVSDKLAKAPAGPKPTKAEKDELATRCILALQRHPDDPKAAAAEVGIRPQAFFGVMRGYRIRHPDKLGQIPETAS